MSLCPSGWLLDTGIPVLQSRVLWLPGPSKSSYVSPHSASWQVLIVVLVSRTTSIFCDFFNFYGSMKTLFEQIFLGLTYNTSWFFECEWILNPAINMTWSDEDFIGRVSRVSRKTHSATTARRTIDRCLGLYRRQWISIFSSSYKDPPGES